MEPVTVIVVGSLGELVKKSIETDSRIVDSKGDRSILLESASLHRLLEEWPVLDADRAAMLETGMKMSISKLQSTEKELEELLSKMEGEVGGANGFHLRLLAFNMLKYRNEIRKQIVELNKLSGGIGRASAIPQDAELVIVKEGWQ
jgi:hypothetical protein